MELNFGYIEGLPEEELRNLADLVRIYNDHKVKNEQKKRYYNGKIKLNEVNLGIALPNTLSRLEIGCSWGAKAVDVLAARSMFDGFVGNAGKSADAMQGIMRRNNLLTNYKKACKEELLYGNVYAAISGKEREARIRFYNPNCAAAKWDAAAGCIECGFVFDDGRLDEEDYAWSPDFVIYHTATDVWELDRSSGHWVAERTPHRFGRPLMVSMSWNATADKPFGQSRLKEPIRRLIQGYVRTIANATIGLEFSTSPQKYLLGVSDDQYDALVNDRFKTYVGSILTSTANPDTGENPTFGQLQQGNISPHVEMLRMLSTQFSAATGLTVTDVGVVNDANPTSSEAILAQSQTLICLAEELNSGNGDALYIIGQMALAVEQGSDPDSLEEEDKEIIAHFKNPAMPSVATTADAAVKIASAREGFAQTDVFLEMLGFDQADIRRVKAQEARARGTNILKEEFAANENIVEGVDGIRSKNVANQPGSGGTDKKLDTKERMRG